MLRLCFYKVVMCSHMYVLVRQVPGGGYSPGAYFDPRGRVCIYPNHTPHISKGLSYTGEQRKRANNTTFQHNASLFHGLNKDKRDRRAKNHAAKACYSMFHGIYIVLNF